MKKILLFVFMIFTNIINAQVANQPSDLEVCDDDTDGIFCFMLSIQDSQVLGSQNPVDYTISYHATQADADTNVSQLSSNSYCNTTSPETIYVRLEDNSNGLFDTTSFQLIVNAKPIVPPSVEIDLFACDSSLNPDGIAVFNLSSNAQFIYGTQSTAAFTLNYFETEANANANTNPITNLSTYTNTSSNQAIYVRLANNSTGCYTIGFFYLFVESPNYTLTQPTPLELCTENSDETGTFDLTDKRTEITNGNNSIVLRYFASQEDLDNYSLTNNTSIVFPTSFTTTTNPQTVYVRALPPNTGLFTCATDITLTLRTLPAPITPQVITSIHTCNDDNDEFIVVDLLSRETEIINGNSNAIVSYHTNFTDAFEGMNPISNPAAYELQIADLTTEGTKTLYVRLESTVQTTNAGEPCFDTAGLTIINTNPLFTNASYDYFTCETGTSTVGTFNFDTITDELSLLHYFQNPEDFLISYHLTEADVIANTAPLANGFQNTTNPQAVFIRAENNNTGCVETNNIPVLILNVDSYPIINETPTPLEKCSLNVNPTTTFSLFNTVNEVKDGRPLTVTFYETLTDAENTENPILNSYYSVTELGQQTLHIRAENENGCYALTTVDLILTNECLPSSYIFDSYLCDDDMGGLECFDLTSRLQDVLQNTDPNSVTVSYYTSRQDAFNTVNAIASPETFCTTELNNEIHIRVEEIATGNAYVKILRLFGLVIEAITPTALEVCDADNDGITGFPLDEKIDEITGGNTNYIVTFYETEADAIAFTNRLDTIYFNTTAYSQTIYARVILPQLFQTNVCYEIVPLELVATTASCYNANYEVTTIPHVIYNVDVVPTANTDDIFTNIRTIPFEFDFFGNTYTKFVIGTNGLVSFNDNYANDNCEWSMDVARSIPSAELYTNTIFGVYHDILNNGTGSLGYGVVGEAPFRKMIIFFDEVNQYGDSCEDSSTTQIILYETLNIIDIQVAQKTSCVDWNDGLALLGIQNENGLEGYFPPNRNTGVWDALNEGYRFTPVTVYENTPVIVCDDGENGFLTFDLSALEESVLGDITNGTITYFNSEEDLINDTNMLPLSYTNIKNSQVIYARILNTTTNEVTIKTATLAVIDCNMDTDADGVATMDEDVNGDGDLGNDDTDGDGIPDFIDEDDDGDYVLTNLELINTATGLPENGFLDTDGDMIPNHRDADDDGDGTLTVDEDYNGNNNPEDDDTNNNNIPDYLDNMVFLSVDEFTTTSIRMYPNPAKDKLTIESLVNVRIKNIEIYSVDGRLVHTQNQAVPTNNLTINVSDFASGFYLLRMKSENNTVITKQFIVE